MLPTFTGMYALFFLLLSFAENSRSIATPDITVLKLAHHKTAELKYKLIQWLHTRGGMDLSSTNSRTGQWLESGASQMEPYHISSMEEAVHVGFYHPPPPKYQR